MQNDQNLQSVDILITEFENSAQYDDDGHEYWTARNLQVFLGYAKWENFETVIQRAKLAYIQSNQKSEDHFQEVFPDTRKNPLGGRPSADYHLGRYACYLIAQKGEPRKKQIAVSSKTLPSWTINHDHNHPRPR